MNKSSVILANGSNMGTTISSLPIGSSISLFCCLIVGLGLHILGIFCCFKEHRKLRKQKIILLNLSVVEVTTILHSMLHLAASYVPWSRKQKLVANDVFVTSYHAVTSLFYCSMILIAVDRLVCVLSPTKHYVHMRRSTLRKIVLVIWCFSIINSVAFTFVPVSIDTRAEIILYSSYAAQGVFLLISTTAYSLVGLSMFRRSSLGVVQHTPRTSPRRIKRTFSVSFSLVVTFVVFYMVPNYVRTRDKTLEVVMVAVTYFGLSVDPILYILLHNALRKSAIKALKCTCCYVPTQAYNSLRTLTWSFAETWNSTTRRNRSSRTSLISTITNVTSKKFTTISATVTIKLQNEVTFNSSQIPGITVKGSSVGAQVSNVTNATNVTHREPTPEMDVYTNGVLVQNSKETTV